MPLVCGFDALKPLIMSASSLPLASGCAHPARANESHGAPSAIGPYSQAIECGGWVFCSGQIGLEPGSGSLVTGGIEAETRRALENLRAVLAGAGLSLADVVKTTIFLADLADFELVNRIYGEHFKAPYPARSTVQAAALPCRARVEIEALARRRRPG